MKHSTAIAAFRAQILPSLAKGFPGVIYDPVIRRAGQLVTCSPGGQATLKLPVPEQILKLYIVHNQTDPSVFSNLVLDNDGFTTVRIDSPSEYIAMESIYNQTTKEPGLEWADGYSAMEIKFAHDEAQDIVGKFMGAMPICVGQKWQLQLDVSDKATDDVRVFIYVQSVAPIATPIFYPNIFKSTMEFGEIGNASEKSQNIFGVHHTLFRMYIKDAGWINKLSFLFGDVTVQKFDEYSHAMSARQLGKSYAPMRTAGFYVVDEITRHPFNSVLNLKAPSFSIMTTIKTPAALQTAYEAALKSDANAAAPVPPVNAIIYHRGWVQSPAAQAIDK